MPRRNAMRSSRQVGRPRGSITNRRTRRSTTRYRVPRSVGAYRGEFLIRKLRYSINLGASHALTSTSGAPSSDFIYRANDLYDSYAGVGGHQARTYDQLIEMYRHFAILGSKMTLDIAYGAVSSTSNDMSVNLVLSDSSSSMTNTGAITEAARRRYRILTAGNDRARLVGTYSYKVNGGKDILDDATLWGTSAASPTNVWYWHVVAYQPDGNTEVLSFTGIIEYTAIFFHAITPPQS